MRRGVGKRLRALFVLVGLLASGQAIVLVSLSRASSHDLPVDKDALEKLTERSAGKTGLTNQFTLDALRASVASSGNRGLAVDLTAVGELLDGTPLDASKLYGRIWYGPYPFEAGETRMAYKRFRKSATVSGGKAFVALADLFDAPYNSEGWSDRGQVALRFELALSSEGNDRQLGVYDTILAFSKDDDTIERLPTIVEGPFVNLVQSDDPTSLVVAFETDRPVRARVELRERGEGAETRVFPEQLSGRRHEIRVSGLAPRTDYEYRVVGDDYSSRWLGVRTAPADATSAVRLAYLGDTRAGVGGGMNSYMGVNYNTLGALTRLALEKDADALLVGGDLVSGYTSVPADFAAQLEAWKQAVTAFWNERPVYAAMGNHEALLKVFDGASLDRWPYDTESAEAVFARLFTHPENGPIPSDLRRPTYKENVYSLRYGPVKAIAFNNNYWVSYQSSTYGGAPEGYLLEDQLSWIEAELEAAEKDPQVRWVILYAQEPVFPNGGHVGDSMWHRGDNRVRAHVWRNDKLYPEADGMIVVRNRFVRAVASSPKVAAVLGSDEHAYHRVLIDEQVPIGDIDTDDRNKSGKIDVDVGEVASPLADLRHGVWYLVCGGGGAPYYAEEDAPWNEYWRRRPRKLASGLEGFRYSSQENFLLFDADAERIGVTVYNRHGEVIDRVPDLMQDK